MPASPAIRADFTALWVALAVLGASGASAADTQDAKPTPSATEAETLANAPGKPMADSPPPSSEAAPNAAGVKAGLAGSFLSSRFASQHQNVQDAAKYLKEALAHDPNNLKLKHDTMRATLMAGDSATAIAIAKDFNDEVKSDPLVACLRMLDEVKQKDYESAQKFLEMPPSSGLFGVVRPLMLQWLKLGAGAAPEKTALQASIEKSGFFAPFFIYHAALLNDVSGNDAEALAYYKKSAAQIEVAPYRMVEAFANYELRHDQAEAAQSLFDRYAKANPDSSLLPDKIAPVSTPVKPLVGTANEGLAEVFFTTASILFSEEASQDTFLYLRIALDLRPEFPPAQLMLANLYEQAGEFDHAIATYDTMSKGTVFYRRGQVRKALNLEALGKRDEAISYLDAISTQNPGDSIALITKGDMLRVELRYKEAADAYSEAVTRSEPLKNSDWPLLYARGISYERAGEWPKAESDFQRALTLAPNQPDVLNYLAYSWLMMNRNVGQAMADLELALSARPNDPHIIDSLGVAKMLTGDYKSAASYFEKAVDGMPEDATVIEHLGDAYWRLDRTTEAKYQWNKALELKPEDEQIPVLHRKLAEGLPPAVVVEVPAADNDDAPVHATGDEAAPEAASVDTGGKSSFNTEKPELAPVKSLKEKLLDKFKRAIKPPAPTEDDAPAHE